MKLRSRTFGNPSNWLLINRINGFPLLSADERFILFSDFGHKEDVIRLGNKFLQASGGPAARYVISLRTPVIVNHRDAKNQREDSNKGLLC